MTNYTIRVAGFEWVEAARLRPHPKNWKLHPQQQREALVGLLNEIGVADALLVYRSEREDGAMVVIDGHLRLDVLDRVPVLVTDLTDAEADVLLASYDPIALMATPDVGAVSALLATVRVEDAQLTQALEGFARRFGVYDPDRFSDAADDEEEGDGSSSSADMFNAFRDSAAGEYHPTLAPSIAGIEVSEKDVAAAAAKLEKQYQRERKLLLVSCPACEGEFYVDA